MSLCSGRVDGINPGGLLGVAAAGCCWGTIGGEKDGACLLDGVADVGGALGKAAFGVGALVVAAALGEAALGEDALGVGVAVLVGGLPDPPHPEIKITSIPTDSLNES